MKKLFTIFTLFAASVFMAQPVFQYSNTASLSGSFSGTVYAGTKPGSPGPAGAGVTFNFSSLTFTPMGTATILSPTATPYASSFPAATWAAAITTTAGSMYVYYNNQSTYYDQIGNGITATSGQTYTPDPKRHLIYPFSYGNSYTDSYQCVSCSPGTFTVSYDAYGTLLINGKTYNNVARVVNMFGSPYYNYFNTNPIYAIFSYDSSTSGGATSTYIEAPTVAGIKENYVVEHMNVFPNPASGLVKIENTNFVKVDVEIVDMLGKTIRPKERLAQGETITIDISSFAKGMYFLKYKDEFNNDSFSKLIVE